jgi:hypothetical protein
VRDELVGIECVDVGEDGGDVAAHVGAPVCASLRNCMQFLRVTVCSLMAAGNGPAGSDNGRRGVLSDNGQRGVML